MLDGHGGNNEEPVHKVLLQTGSDLPGAPHVTAEHVAEANVSEVRACSRGLLLTRF